MTVYVLTGKADHGPFTVSNGTGWQSRRVLDSLKEVVGWQRRIEAMFLDIELPKLPTWKIIKVESHDYN